MTVRCTKNHGRAERDDHRQRRRSKVTEFMDKSPHPGKDQYQWLLYSPIHGDAVEFRNVSINELKREGARKPLNGGGDANQDSLGPFRLWLTFRATTDGTIWAVRETCHWESETGTKTCAPPYLRFVRPFPASGRSRKVDLKQGCRFVMMVPLRS